MHVLMIEDSEDDYLLFKRTIGKVVDITLVWRDTLESGLDYVAHHSVDVLLTDMALPDGSGLEAVLRIQSRFPALPLVILSGSSTDSVALDAVRHGAQDYLVKGHINAEMVEKSLRYALERKHVQNALAEERNLLRTLVDALPDAIYIKDTEHRTVFSNLARARSFGLQSPSETIGKSDYDFVSPEMAAQFHADENRIFETGLPLTNHEERTVGPGDSLIWASTTKLPLHNLSGELIGLVGITRDITERKERERQLRYYASMQENVSDAVVATDLDFRIQSWNQAAERTYGWRSEEVLGKTTFEILQTQYESEEQKREIRNGFMAKGSWKGEFIQRRKDGSLVNVLSATSLFKDEQGNPVGIVSVHHDITDRKIAEDALRQSLEKEKELSKLKSLLNSMVSHEFRTPLATILSNTQMLMTHRDKMTPDKVDVNLNRIVKQVEHLTSVISDMLEVAQEDSVTFRPVDVDLNATCTDILEDFQNRTDITHEIVYTCDRKPPVLKLDLRLMRQIINNLVSNALKYSPNGKTVFVDLHASDDKAVLCVRDQGIGIPLADQQRLFEPFHRAGNVESISGTGLGLTITKHSVEMHGGTISIDSEVGVGTSVCINLPYASLDEKLNEVLQTSSGER